MKYIVEIEGQKFELPEHIAQDDAQVKRALVPYYPEAGNAQITRKTDGDTTTLTVIKRAGSKGVDLASVLDACAGGQNPAIEMYQHLSQAAPMDPLHILEMDAAIETAIYEGRRQGDAISTALRRLDSAQAQPAPFMVRGF
jgi:hypothetical protein